MDELPKLEGKALVAGNFFEISTTCAVERGSTVCCGSVALILSSLAAVLGVSCRSAKAYLISYNLGDVMLLTLLMLLILSLILFFVILGPISRKYEKYSL